MMVTANSIETASMNPAADFKLMVADLIEARQPFAYIIQPGADNHNGSLYRHGVDISPWLAKFKDRIRIDQSYGNQTFEGSSIVSIQPTTKEEYIAAATELIKRCRARNGKSVLSCAWAERSEDARPYDWPSIIHTLFAHYKDSFRFFFYHPLTGFWVGTSPEILIDFDKTTGEFTTMALAGTRSGICGNWDEKNVTENDFVVRYIVDKLQSLGISATVDSGTTLRHGIVEHICHIISGKAPITMLPQIIDAINPTPALCGYPKADAIADINYAENHQRGCYGGYIAIDTPQRYCAHVILRSIQFYDNSWALYGGSGITPDSDPEEEYTEICNKIKPHLQALGVEA